jgi:hypothetical protein
MQTDVMNIYNQTTPPVFYTYQTGVQYTRGKSLEIGMAQLEASNEQSDIVCAGPVYPMTDYGGHLDANGYRWYGEMLGKVYYKHKILGEDFKPLQPEKISRDPDNDRKIVIQFHVPHPPLVFDEKTVKKETNYGFEVYQRRKLSLESVNIVNGNTVEIICSEALTGKVEIIYAGQSTQGHGNLRDSDDYPACFPYVNIDEKDASGNYIYPRSNDRTLRPSYEPKDENGNVIYGKPYPLYNFSVAFYYALQEGENEKEIALKISTPKAHKNRIQILQYGKTLKVISTQGESPEVRIYDLAGRLIQNFGKQQHSNYLLPALSPGCYIVAAKTANESANQKIILN